GRRDLVAEMEIAAPERRHVGLDAGERVGLVHEAGGEHALGHGRIPWVASPECRMRRRRGPGFAWRVAQCARGVHGGCAGRDPMCRMLASLLMGGLLIAAALLPAGPARAESVLRVSPHADLKVLDPHTNTATITIMHAHMIYDTLFAWDEDLKPRPQMV